MISVRDNDPANTSYSSHGPLAWMSARPSHCQHSLACFIGLSSFCLPSIRLFSRAHVLFRVLIFLGTYTLPISILDPPMSLTPIIDLGVLRPNAACFLYLCDVYIYIYIWSSKYLRAIACSVNAMADWHWVSRLISCRVGRSALRPFDALFDLTPSAPCSSSILFYSAGHKESPERCGYPIRNSDHFRNGQLPTHLALWLVIRCFEQAIDRRGF
ncbi:hypothetical protein BJY52DRAFT_173756 [Lactarius psammicola]|nr:hypothetical protein BJY52DRAFT_173756 [Lactarius psammicola]